MRLLKNSIFFFSVLSVLLFLAACATISKGGITKKSEETTIETLLSSLCLCGKGAILKYLRP